MWWECSECGEHVECTRAPAVCRECGTAGIIFVPVGVIDPMLGDPEADGLRAVWLKAGLEQAQATMTD